MGQLHNISQLLLCIIIFSVTATPLRAQEQHTSHTVRLYLKGSHQFQFAGYYAALEKGYYADAGLDVKFIEKVPDIPGDEAILNDMADYAIMDSSVLIKQAQGKPIKIIAAIFQHSPLILLSLKRSGIRTIHDLSGKRITFSKEEDAPLYAMLRHSGINDGDYVYVPNNHRLEDLLEGRVDALAAYMIDQPDTLDRLGFDHYIIDPASYGLDFYGDMLITSDREISADKKRVNAFRNASILGWEYALKHPVEITDLIINKYNKSLSRQHQLSEARQTRLAIAPALVKIGYIDPQRIKAIAEIYSEVGLIPGDFDSSQTYVVTHYRSPWLDKLIHILALTLTVTLLYLALLRYRQSQQQNKLEKTIAEANRLFTTAFDSSPLMMAITRIPECELTMANDAMLRTLGYRRDEIIGKTSLEIGLLDAQTKSASLKQLEVNGQSRIDIAFRTRNGDERYGRLSANLITYHDYEAALLIIEDTTEKRHSDEALRSSELRFRSIFDYSLSGIALADENGSLITINQAFAEILGYTSDELMGVPFREFSHPDDLPKEDELLNQVRRGDIDHYQFKKRLIRHDDTLAWVEIAVSVIRDEHGNPFRYVSVINDITEQVHAERENQRLQRQLQQTQKMEAIGLLTGGIAHDFNNILASILGFAELSRSLYGQTLPGKLDDYLAEIITAGQRARDIVEQLLTFSRGNVSKAELLNPTPVIKEAVKLLRSTLPTTVELVVELEEIEEKLIYTTPVQLHQVLLNLVLNARSAVHDTGRILIRSKPISISKSICDSCHDEIEGEYIVIEVCDSGPGIEPDMIPRIFEPFFTTREMGEGSGMGLAMVHGILHGANGHVRVLNSDLGGACVQLLYPQQSATITRVEEPAAEYELSHSNLPGKHILVVDDEVPITELMQELLGLNDYQVTVFNDPQKALEAFRRNPQGFDLILTDQTMPGMTGTELAAQIRELRKDIPVVLSTGYSNVIHENNMSQFEIDRLLYKPINSKQLLGTIAELLSATVH